MWGQKWGEMIWGGSSAAAVQIPFGPWTLLFLGFILGVCAVYANRSRTARVVPFVMVLLVPVVAVIAISLPHTFSNGTVADADEVNANFNAIVDQLNVRFGFAPNISELAFELDNRPAPGEFLVNCLAPVDDPDGDIVTVIFIVTQNGFQLDPRVRTAAAGTTASHGFVEALPGDIFSCTARPDDGRQFGETLTKDFVVP